MGYALMMGNCGCCGRTMSYNPINVPSHRFDGTNKEPICLACITYINDKRSEKGLELWPVAADAYVGCKEEEL